MKKNCQKNWQYRYITVFGKMCIIETLMLPTLTHIAAILPNMYRQKIDEIKKICKKFLRQNKRPIVDSEKTLYAINSKKRLSITRISEFWTALKISWLKRFTSSRSF